jgi:hypothetical protein
MCPVSPKLWPNIETLNKENPNFKFSIEKVKSNENLTEADREVLTVNSGHNDAHGFLPESELGKANPNICFMEGNSPTPSEISSCDLINNVTGPYKATTSKVGVTILEGIFIGGTALVSKGAGALIGTSAPSLVPALATAYSGFNTINDIKHTAELIEDNKASNLSVGLSLISTGLSSAATAAFGYSTYAAAVGTVETLTVVGAPAGGITLGTAAVSGLVGTALTVASWGTTYLSDKLK